MKLRPRQFLATVSAIAVAFAGVACDDEDDAATEGGSIEVAVTAQPDALDPALSYTLPGLEPMAVVYTPLLTYRRAEGAEGAELIPGLAEALPEVSGDGRTYTLTMRDGLRYSDGTPVRASDFERAIQRVLELESPGSGFFLGIDGAQEYVDGDDPEADIAGIETDDETGEIRIELLAPDGTFPNVLAMNFAALVPGDTPFENQTKDPPPGVGPYEITESVPNREFVLEKSDGFDELEIPGLPAGNLDRITVRIERSIATQAQDVIDGELDYMQDVPPADLVARIREEHADRFSEYVTGNTSYVFLNTQEPPFDDERVRQAAAFAIDRPGIARLFGGRLEPTCNFLPPQVPGFEEIEPCPYGDPADPPDIDRARELIREAGAEGAEVTVWGPLGGTSEQVTQAVAENFSQIGLDATPELLDFAVYIPTIGDESTHAQAGVLDFFQDFPHPANFLNQFSGSSIAEEGNVAFSRVEEPGITETIDTLKQEQDLAAVETEWAGVDREVIESAYAIPIGHQRYTTFVSERMDPECVLVHPVYAHVYSSFCLE